MPLQKHTRSSGAMPSGAANKTAKHRAASGTSTAVTDYQPAWKTGSKTGGPSSAAAAPAGSHPAGTAVATACTAAGSATVSATAADNSRATAVGGAPIAGGSSSSESTCCQHGATAAAVPHCRPATDPTSTAVGGHGQPHSHQYVGGLPKASLAEITQPTTCQLLQLPAGASYQQPGSIHGQINSTASSAGTSAAMAALHSAASSLSAAAAAAAASGGGGGGGGGSSCGGASGGRHGSKRKSVAAKLDLKSMPLQALLSLSSAPIAVEWAADAAGNPSASAQVTCCALCLICNRCTRAQSL